MTTPQHPRKPEPVAYKGEALDAERGPGLGCFWFQMILLTASIIITPLTVTWNWPVWITLVLFVTVMLLLLLTGQTMIFLLRLVAAGRSEGRRRPLASTTPTVGEIEDATPATETAAEAPPEADALVPAVVQPVADLGFEPSDDVARTAVAYAADLADLAASRYDLTLDFSVDSVRDVERVIADDMFRTRPDDWDKDPKRREQTDGFGKGLGFYVGEVIRIYYGGEWGWAPDESGGRAYAMRVGEALMWPTARGIRRLVNGSEDDLYAYIVLLVANDPERATELPFRTDTTTGDDPSGVRQ